MVEDVFKSINTQREVELSQIICMCSSVYIYDVDIACVLITHSYKALAYILQCYKISAVICVPSVQLSDQ